MNIDKRTASQAGGAGCLKSGIRIGTMLPGSDSRRITCVPMVLVCPRRTSNTIPPSATKTSDDLKGTDGGVTERSKSTKVPRVERTVYTTGRSTRLFRIFLRSDDHFYNVFVVEREPAITSILLAYNHRHLKNIKSPRTEKRLLRERVFHLRYVSKPYRINQIVPRPYFLSPFWFQSVQITYELDSFIIPE